MHPPRPSPLDLSLLITCNSKTQCRLEPAVNYGLLKMKSFYLMKQIKSNLHHARGGVPKV